MVLILFADENEMKMKNVIKLNVSILVSKLSRVNLPKKTQKMEVTVGERESGRYYTCNLPVT